MTETGSNPVVSTLEVTAGIIPMEPDVKYTRQWDVTVREWAVAGTIEMQEVLLAEKVGLAQGYAFWLMIQPQKFNFVRMDWIWL